MMGYNLNTTEARAPDDLTNGQWVDPAIPGGTSARNALTDPETPPEVRQAARDLLGMTDPLGWDWVPDPEPRWLDVAASVVLVIAALGVICMIGYVALLPGGVL